jgi:RHS repeat-associated protein
LKSIGFWPNRIKKSERVVSALSRQSFSQSFTWSELGLLQSESYPVCGHATCTGSPGTTTPRTLSYSYLWGHLTNVPGWATIAYHPNGLVSRVSHQNGVIDTITNDPFEMARPLKIETSGATLNFKSGDYAYDAAGNIVKIGTDWFLYDPRSRLVASRVDDQPDLPGVDRYQSYLFDRYGNLKETTTQIGTGTPVTRTAPVVVTTNRFSLGNYDAFGNVTSYSAQSYAWDVLRTLKGTPGKLLLYGPGDERIWEFAYTNGQDPSTFRETFSLRGVGGQVLREYRLTGGNTTGNWSLAEEFIYRDGQLLASVTSTQTTHYTLDHLGTPRLATGNGGATLAYHAYFPFGEEATNPGQNAQRMKFTGHQRDNLGGGLTDDLDYMHARYGSPMTGRFLSLDPVLGYPANPQSWNRYAYVMGNPMVFTDPFGLAIDDATNQGGQERMPRFREERPLIVIGEEIDDPLHPDGYKAENQRFGLQPEIDIAKNFYQDNFDRYAVEGRYGLAYLNYFADWLVPEDTTGLVLAVVPIPVGKAAQLARLGKGAVSGANGLRLSGYSRHALNQAISREGTGVSARAILDAIRNPLKVIPKAGNTTLVIGRDAAVVLNESGQAVTVWAKSSAGWRLF